MWPELFAAALFCVPRTSSGHKKAIKKLLETFISRWSDFAATFPATSWAT